MGRKQRRRLVGECTNPEHTIHWFPLQHPLLRYVRIICFPILESESSVAASLYLLSSNLPLISLGSLACYALHGGHLLFSLAVVAFYISSLLHPYRRPPFLLLPALAFCAFLGLYIASFLASSLGAAC